MAGSAAAESDGGYTLYLVRHAEKQPDGSRDPALTTKGLQRSEQLAKWLSDKDIQAIWSSDFRRTRDTAMPLLRQLELELNSYDPRNQSTLVESLLAQQKNALIVGHSNTIPELARLLCECAVADLDDTEYDRLIVISVADDATTIKTLQQNRVFQP